MGKQNTRAIMEWQLGSGKRFVIRSSASRFDDVADVMDRPWSEWQGTDLNGKVYTG